LSVSPIVIVLFLLAGVFFVSVLALVGFEDWESFSHRHSTRRIVRGGGGIDIQNTQLHLPIPPFLFPPFQDDILHAAGFIAVSTTCVKAIATSITLVVFTIVVAVAMTDVIDVTDASKRRSELGSQRLSIRIVRLGALVGGRSGCLRDAVVGGADSPRDGGNHTAGTSPVDSFPPGDVWPCLGLVLLSTR
jgi:hypothetical protein